MSNSKKVFLSYLLLYKLSINFSINHLKHFVFKIELSHYSGSKRLEKLSHRLDSDDKTSWFSYAVKILFTNWFLLVNLEEKKQFKDWTDEKEEKSKDALGLITIQEIPLESVAGQYNFAVENKYNKTFAWLQQYSVLLQNLII